MEIPKQLLDNINNYDRAATEEFGVEEFGLRFNINIRHFWSASIEFAPFAKTLVNPFNEEDDNIHFIYLN